MRAWVVTFAGTAINLCLGILYAWSVWKAALIATTDHPAGTPMEGIDAGWVYLSDAEATWAYALCGMLFSLSMIPGGRIQDRYGPRTGAILGGLCLALGCVIAGLSRSYTGLLVGFGLFGGIGMGLGYAAATPAAVKWFGPHRRGLIVGIVVAGFGAAAIYVSPLARYWIGDYGLSGSFIGLGLAFAVVVVGAGSLLAWPPPGYQPPPPPAGFTMSASITRADWAPTQMLGTAQYYALVFLFLASAQSGLLVIANAVTLVKETAPDSEFYARYSWLLPAFVGLVNALGRVGTGYYSDRLGRANAYALNSVLSATVMLALPMIIGSRHLGALFAAVGVAAWQYGGGLSLMPAFTADYFGSKNLGVNYGLVFLGWGSAFFVPQIAGYIKDAFGSMHRAFELSAALLIAGVVVSLMLRRPTATDPG